MVNPDILLILVLVTIVLAVIALSVSLYLFFHMRGKEKSRRPSEIARQALNLAEDIQKQFDNRCSKIVSEIIEKEKLTVKNNSTQHIEENRAESQEVEKQTVSEESVPVFVSEHMFGEYSDSDKGFLVEDMTNERTPRSQIEIDTISESKAEFSILPDVDASFISSVKSYCDLEKGDWMEYTRIRTVTKGALDRKGDIWHIERKASIVLE